MLLFFVCVLSLALLSLCTETIASSTEHCCEKHCEQEWFPTVGHFLHPPPLCRRLHIQRCVSGPSYLHTVTLCINRLIFKNFTFNLALCAYMLSVFLITFFYVILDFYKSEVIRDSLVSYVKNDKPVFLKAPIDTSFSQFHYNVKYK